MVRQLFEQYTAKQEKVKVLEVTVVKAEHVSVRGFFSRHLKFLKYFMEIPDPYVILRVHSSPNSQQKTSVIPNTHDPVWEETFKFYLHEKKKNTLEITLKDEDVFKDDLVGEAEPIELDDLAVDTEFVKTLTVNEKTSLVVKLLLKWDDTMELRMSYDLCDAEKDFLQKRKEMILKKMPEIFGEDKAPKTIDEVPVIGIMGSGGGFRAACGLSGVMMALEESKIFHCSTYLTGLSGSSWYISTLYHSEAWPNCTCEQMADSLRRKFNTDKFSHLHLYFIRLMKEKRKRGQLVRLVDLFGFFIGDFLLDNQKSKLSNQSRKVMLGEVPLPITTGIRVRSDLPAAEFSEWVEFTPFEYGMAKYGVFGKTEDFGGKYYKGNLIKKFEESPLSYLQGIWGSAFGIILNTLFHKKDQSEEEVRKELEKSAIEEAKRCKTDEHDSEDEDDDDDLPEDEKDGSAEDKDQDEVDKNKKDGSVKHEDVVERGKHWILDALNPYNLFANRRGKAAEVFNILRGLEFKREQDDEYDQAPGSHKSMCLVDSGIAFNSPYPMLLRPERKVEIILSFDFSQRDGGDKEPPFSTLLKAERWAKDNGLPFPQIYGNPILEDPELQECYVFEDTTDPDCPTILHFPLINKTFKEFSEPGVPRKSEEDKEFGNFAIFDDPDEPYSSFNFEYDHKHFNRLCKLMRYNTLAHMDTIKEKIASQIDFRRNNPDYCSQ